MIRHLQLGQMWVELNTHTVESATMLLRPRSACSFQSLCTSRKGDNLAPAEDKPNLSTDHRNGTLHVTPSLARPDGNNGGA